MNKFKTAHRTWTIISNNRSVSSCGTDTQARVYFWAAHISLLQAKNNESTSSAAYNNHDKFAHFKSMWSETAADVSKALSMCTVADSWVSGLLALDEELLYAQSRVEYWEATLTDYDRNVSAQSLAAIDVKLSSQIEKDEMEEAVIYCTLEDFRHGLSTYPECSRFVVLEDEGGGVSIEPKEGISDPIGEVAAAAAVIAARKENMLVLRSLKATISSTYSAAVADLVPELNSAAIASGEPLSAVRLRNIFNHLSVAELQNINKKTFKRITTPVPNSVFFDPAFQAEKLETGAEIVRLVLCSKRDDTWPLYEKANALWIKERQGWQARKGAQRELEVKTLALQEANELLVRVTAARKEMDENSTLLKRISDLSASAAVPLSYIPGPVPLGGIAHAVSAITEQANKAWLAKDKVLAEMTVTAVTQLHLAASKAADVANKTAKEARKVAQEAEDAAALRAQAIRKAYLDNLYPPFDSLSEAEWCAWATRLVQSGCGKTAVIAHLTDHAMCDPLWALDLVQSALTSKNEEDRAEERKYNYSRLRTAEMAHQTAGAALAAANEVTKKVELEVETARLRLFGATEQHQHCKRELESCNSALNELEKRENAKMPNINESISAKKTEFCTALSLFEVACADLGSSEESMLACVAKLALAEHTAAPFQIKAAQAEEEFKRIQCRTSIYDENNLVNSSVLFRLPQIDR